MSPGGRHNVAGSKFEHPGQQNRIYDAKTWLAGTLLDGLKLLIIE